MFCILFTWNILNNYGRLNVKNNTLNESITNTEQDTKEKMFVTDDFFRRMQLQNLVWSGAVIFSIILIFRELLQSIILGKVYWKKKENFLEIGIILISFFILFVQLDEKIGHQMAAFGILFTWGELVLLIGRHPNLAVYIEMLKTVTKSFFKFLLWYSLLIIAFALSFYTLFCDNLNEHNFSDPFISMFKVSVMLTGEFETDSIPLDNYPGSSHILFVLFVFLIAIVLFNLLNGLAISDTQRIKSDVQLVVYKSQINMISAIEILMHNSKLWENVSSKIKSLFCCFKNTGGYKSVQCCCINTLYCSADIFPENEEGRIIIQPYNDNKIYKDNMKSTEFKGPLCCPLKKCTVMKMEAEIVELARDIIVNKRIRSETTNLELRVINIEEKIENILEILQKGNLTNSRSFTSPTLRDVSETIQIQKNKLQ